MSIIRSKVVKGITVAALATAIGLTLAPAALAMRIVRVTGTPYLAYSYDGAGFVSCNAGGQMNVRTGSELKLTTNYYGGVIAEIKVDFYKWQYDATLGRYRWVHRAATNWDNQYVPAQESTNFAHNFTYPVPSRGHWSAMYTIRTTDATNYYPLGTIRVDVDTTSDFVGTYEGSGDWCTF